MKTTLALQNGMQKFLTVMAFGLLSISAKSTGNHDSLQTVVLPAAKAQSVNSIEFTATLNNNRTDLKWMAASETSISHFVIEKSADGINFKEAAVVFAFEDAAGTMVYNFPDKLNEQASVVHYRVCMIAENGKMNYSATRSIVIVTRDVKKADKKNGKN